MTDRDTLDQIHKPTVTRPLLGLTILVVEDSKYACDAVRLMCLHSGARLRRADCLESARRHLKVYLPSVIIIDMGLPDGSGAELIAELAHAMPRVSVIIATSGDAFAEDVAYAAGADGFLAKPMANLGIFQNAILQHLPEQQRPNGPRTLNTGIICPDPVAFREDMAHIATLLGGSVDENTADYVTLFLSGVARAAEDTALEHAACDLREARANGSNYRNEIARVMSLVDDRLEDAVAI